MLNMPWRKAQRVRRKWREELGNLSVLGSKRMHKPVLRVRATKVAGLSFLGFGEEVRNFTGNKNGGYTTNADGLDRVRDGTVGGETLGEIEGNLDDCINGGPPLQVLMEGRVVADFCVNLTSGNIFKKGSVRFTPMVCACKFWKSKGESADGRSLRGRIRTKREGGCQEGVPERQGGRRPYCCAV